MTQLETKDRLLDAAERLFAERGYTATSLRDITTDAEANLASVNYHFGGKEGLLQAVFDRRLAPVNTERLRLLDVFAKAAAPGTPSLEEVLWSFLSPPFHKLEEADEGARHFLRIVGRMHSDPVRWGEFFQRQFAPIAQRFEVAFVTALPHLGPAEVVQRMHYVIGAMAHTFCWAEKMCALGARGTGEWNRTLDSLMGFAAAGLRAPSGGSQVSEPASSRAPGDPDPTGDAT